MKKRVRLLREEAAPFLCRKRRRHFLCLFPTIATGNWPGKTVTNAQGRCTQGEHGYILVDLPGTYSLMAHSAEEECARDFICFGGADASIVVCDATCLERNLNLVLQTMEITGCVVVCVNLMDEAKKKNLRIDLELLSHRLGVPVVGASARSRVGLAELMDSVEHVVSCNVCASPVPIRYPHEVEGALAVLTPALEGKWKERISPRWVALRLLCGDESLSEAMKTHLGGGRLPSGGILEDESVVRALGAAQSLLEAQDMTQEKLRDAVAASVVRAAERACSGVVLAERGDYRARDRKIDHFLTSRWTGIPVMLLLLAAVFWLTITGANYPSQLLSNGLFWVQDRLTELFLRLGAPDWLHGALVLGVYRVLACDVTSYRDAKRA